MVALNNGEAAIIVDSVRAVLWLFFGKNMTNVLEWILQLEQISVSTSIESLCIIDIYLEQISLGNN